jgi:hypothetical protein
VKFTTKTLTSWNSEPESLPAPVWEMLKCTVAKGFSPGVAYWAEIGAPGRSLHCQVPLDLIGQGDRLHLAYTRQCLKCFLPLMSHWKFFCWPSRFESSSGKKERTSLDSLPSTLPSQCSTCWFISSHFSTYFYIRHSKGPFSWNFIIWS